MAEGVNVQTLEVLRDLEAALRRFAGEVQESLLAVEGEIQRTREWLEDRIAHWRHEVERWGQQIEEADEDDDVGYAQVQLDAAEEELATAKRWAHRFEQSADEYQRQAHRCRRVASDHVSRGCAFLSFRHAELHQYISVGSLGSASSAAAALPAAPTRQQPDGAQQKVMREMVRNGWYGQTGLNRLFKNFEGSHFLNPAIPGVMKNLGLMGYGARSQAKGAARVLLYATVIHQDSRFELLAVDKQAQASHGRTDKDLWFRHRATGTLCRIEVKDVAASSQRSDVDRLLRQLENMYGEYLESRELQAWVNRQEAIPEVKLCGRTLDIPVYERIKQNQFGAVLDDFDRRALLAKGRGDVPRKP